MFISTRDQSCSGRNRVYRHKTVSFSHISLLSRLTAASSGSRDSTRTVTQESFDQSQRRRAKTKNNSKSIKTRKTKKVKILDMACQSKTDTASQGVDVFDFLDQDQINPSHNLGIARPRASGLPRLLPANEQEESDKESIAKSQFSDSMISLNESTTSSRPHALKKPRLQTLPEYYPTYPTDQDLNINGGFTFNTYFAGWPGNHTPHLGDGFPVYEPRTNNDQYITERDDYHTGLPGPSPGDR